MPKPGTNQAASAIAEYTPRATAYEASNHGWHAKLADDFVDWAKPTWGNAVLDLACGTGLVTFRMADAVGTDGVVVGVDITPAMLEIARANLQSVGGGQNITIVEADIADSKIQDIDVIKDVVSRRGGFDIISCCSALILLSDAAAAVKLWGALLKPGGRMIVDLPSEKLTIQYIAAELIAHDITTDFPFSRAWIRGQESVEGLYVGAGLEVEMCFMTRSYLPETVYEEGQREEVFEQVVLANYGRTYVERGLVEEARQAWYKWWDRIMEQGHGRFKDGHCLYVCIGRKA